MAKQADFDRDASPEEKSLKDYFVASASSSDDDGDADDGAKRNDRPSIAPLACANQSPSKDDVSPKSTRTTYNPRSSLRRKSRTSDLEALLQSQTPQMLPSAPQAECVDLSPRALRAQRRSTPLLQDSNRNQGIPDDLAEVRKELEMEAQGIELVPSLESVREAAASQKVDAYQTPSKQRAGPRKSALKQTPGPESSPEIDTSQDKATPNLGKRKVVIDESLEFHEIAGRKDPEYIAEQEGMNFVVKGVKKLRVSPRLSVETTSDSSSPIVNAEEARSSPGPSKEEAPVCLMLLRSSLQHSV